MNKVIPIAVGVFIALMAMALLFSFDYRSGTAKEEMDKFSGTPTPTLAPTPEQTPIDPADIVQVDTSVEGTTLSANGGTQKQPLTCSKYDRIYVNATGTTLTMKGACRQIMVNGDNNHIEADATTEFVFNGTGNKVTYSRFVNGKVPSVIENMAGNDVQKVPFAQAPSDSNKQKKK